MFKYSQNYFLENIYSIIRLRQIIITVKLTKYTENIISIFKYINNMRRTGSTVGSEEIFKIDFISEVKKGGGVYLL